MLVALDRLVGRAEFSPEQGARHRDASKYIVDADPFEGVVADVARGRGELRVAGGADRVDACGNLAAAHHLVEQDGCLVTGLARVGNDAAKWWLTESAEERVVVLADDTDLLRDARAEHLVDVDYLLTTDGETGHDAGGLWQRL